MDVTAAIEELSIRRVFAEYCHLADDGRFDDLVELFTANGGFRYESVRAEGREGIRDWFEQNQPPERRGKHMTANSVVDIDGDSAVAVSDFVFFAFEEGRLMPLVAGRYRDELMRVGDRWLIEQREVIRLPGVG